MQLTGNAHRYGVLNIYTNHTDGNLLQKHKTVKLMQWENDPLQSSISKCAEQTKKSRQFALPQIKAQTFSRFLNKMTQTI